MSSTADGMVEHTRGRANVAGPTAKCIGAFEKPKNASDESNADGSRMVSFFNSVILWELPEVDPTFQ
jgi:hypothetical protein